MKRSFKYFLSTFKQKKSFWIAAGIDLLFIMIVLGSSALLSSQIEDGFQRAGTSIEAIEGMTNPLANPLLDYHYQIIMGFVSRSLISLAVAAVIFWAVFVLSRRFIWQQITGKKQNTKKFYLLHLVWIPINIALGLLFFMASAFIALVISQLSDTLGRVLAYPVVYGINLVLVAFVSLPLILTALNYTNIINYSFFSIGSVKKSIKNFFSLAIDKFGLLWKHYIYMSIVLLIISIFLNLFRSNQAYYTGLSALLLVLYFTWVKFYVYGLCQE